MTANDRERLIIPRRDVLRLLGIGGAAATFPGLLAACSNGNGEDGEGALEGGENGESPEGAVTEFAFTGWAIAEGVTPELMEQIISGYEEEHGVTISTSNAFPYEEVLNQVVLQARGGSLNGVVQLDVAWLATVASAANLATLEDIASDVDYLEAALETGKHNGQQVGLPWTTGSIGLVGNAALLDRAGITENPRNIDEFEAALEALASQGGNVVPYAAMTDLLQLKDVIPWMWQFGAQIVEDGTVTLGDDPSVQAVEWYKSLLDRGYIRPGVARNDARTIFAQGDVGYYEDAIIARDIIGGQTDSPDLVDNMVVVPRPVVNAGDDPQTLFWGHVLVVVDDEAAPAAKDFVKFLSGDTDTAVEYFEQTSYPPVTQAAWDTQTLANDEFMTTWTNQVTAYSRAHPFWPYAEYAAMEQTMNEAVQSVMTGSQGAREALSAAGEEIQGLIDSA